jgi:catechol 2,3-dioxygenase-like lactoylglutathione lyase family enzyme
MLSTDHIVFPVWDAKASLTFYGDTLGLPLVGAFAGDDWGGMPWLMMIFGIGDGRELVLVALRGARRPADDGLAADVRHYAFSVSSREDQEAWRRKLQAAGVDVTDEDHGDQHSIYFADPNGVVLEITTPASRPASALNPDAVAFARRWISEAAVLTG